MPNQLNDSLFKHLNENLNKYRQTAPTDLWEGISHDLDKHSLTNTDDKLDQHLKQEFKQFKQKAPLNLWENIVDELKPTTENLSSEQRLDEKIKTSYENPIEAPQNIWWEVEQQLNIDSIWRNMTPTLDKIRHNYRWKLRLRQISAAALLLLLIRGCGFFPDFQPNLIPAGHEKTITKNNLFQSNINTKKEHTAIAQKEQTTHYQPTVKKGNPQSFTPRIASAAASTNRNNSTTKNGNHSTSKLAAQPHQSNIGYTSKDFRTKMLIEHISVPNISTISSAIEKVKEDPSTEQAIISQIHIPLISPKPFLQPTNEIIIKTDKTTVKFRPSFEVGAIAAIRNTILTNDINSKSISSQINRPVNTMPALTSSYGISAEYYFASRHSLSIDLWINSKLRKEYLYNYNNRVASTNVDANYLKASISERFSIFRYGSNSQNSIDIKAGGYIAHLKSSKISYINKPPLLPEHVFNNWDGGFVFMLAQRHTIKSRWSLEYGIRSELGIGNVFSNNKGSISTMLGVSAYTAFRYRF